MGSAADMIVSPFVSMCIGFSAGIVSTAGFHFFEHIIFKYLKLHDTCGVAYLHMVPGFIGGIIGCLVAGVTPETKYGEDIGTVYPMMGGDYTRGNSKQGGIQVAMVFTTIGIAALSGAATGAILRIPWIWDSPLELYNDKSFFKYEKGDHDTELKIDDSNPAAEL